jgi:hypothetical protein
MNGYETATHTPHTHKHHNTHTQTPHTAAAADIFLKKPTAGQRGDNATPFYKKYVYVAIFVLCL